MNFDDLTSEDLFKLNEEQRKELIKSSSEIYLRQVELAAALTDTDYEIFLKETIDYTKNRIKMYVEEEQYEVSFFLSEIIKILENEKNGIHS